MAHPLVEVVVFGILEGSLYGLIGLSVSLTAGVMKIFNLAQGPLLLLGGYASFWLFVLYGIDPFFSLVFTLPIFYLLGMAIQKILIDPSTVIEEFQVSGSLIMTYALALVVMDSIVIVWSGDFRIINVNYAYASTSLAGLEVNTVRVTTLLVAAGFLIVLHLLMTKTEFGKAMRALSQDREAAMLMGVNFGRIAHMTAGLSSIVAAMTGTLFAMTHYLQPGLGWSLTLKGFIILTFGGLGSVPGVVIGGILVGVCENIGAFFIGGWARDIVAFIILVLILILRPYGLLGMKEA